MPPAQIAIVTLVATFVACAGDGTPQGDLTSGTGALTAKLYWEGSCNFLACCSCYRHEHETQVPGSFTCGGITCNEKPKCGDADPAKFYVPNFACTQEDPNCSDNETWLVLPKVGGQCGKQYLVCYEGQSVTVTVKDASDKNQLYEASTGVFTALGLAPGAGPVVKIYADPNDPAVANDPACGCCGPPCSGKSVICACQPKGPGTCTGTPGNYEISYPNGVKTTHSGLTVTFTKDGVLCYTAESAIPSATDWSMTFRDPQGDVLGVTHMNPMQPGTGTIDCDGKSYEVKASDPGCQETFFPSMTAACPLPGQ